MTEISEAAKKAAERMFSRWIDVCPETYAHRDAIAEEEIQAAINEATEGLREENEGLRTVICCLKGKADDYYKSLLSAIKLSAKERRKH